MYTFPGARKEFKITPTYILLTAASVIFSWLIHEWAHWLTGEFLGNTMAMTLNTTYPVVGDYRTPWDGQWIDVAGPFITLVLSFLSYGMLRRQGSMYWFPLLLTGLYMRSLAGIMNIVHLNDEGRLGKFLGVGTFTLSIIMVALLSYLVYDIRKIRNLQSKLIAITFLLIMLFSSILILTDQALKIRLL